MNVQELGIPFGVYIYSYATSDAQARSEAEHVLRLISGYNFVPNLFRFGAGRNGNRSNTKSKYLRRHYRKRWILVRSLRQYKLVDKLPCRIGTVCKMGGTV